MNIKNPTRRQFMSMLRQSMLMTSVMAILAFLCFLFFASYNYAVFEPGYITNTAHFFDELRYGVCEFANLAFVGAGVLNAVLCFNFAWSKKQTNVILSLGMRKGDIYFAKILGGIVPMGIALTLAGVVETIANYAGNYIVDNRFFAMAAFTMLQYLVVYVLSFVLSSAVMANTGNLVEGTVFTVIIASFPTMLNGFLSSTFWLFTHGAYLDGDYHNSAVWNWSKPFEVFESIGAGLMTSYFDMGQTNFPTLTEWSGIMMPAIYAVAAILLGYIGFKKRRNEICGTWGRAKVMNEITGALTGFYAMYVFGYFALTSDHGDAGVLTYLVCCGIFALVYVAFKLIFGYKRKADLKKALNRIPAYAMGLAAVLIVFSLGLFGYSSQVPEASGIQSVTVSSPYYKMLDGSLAGSSEFALKVTAKSLAGFPNLDGTMYYYVEDAAPAITFTDYTDIEKVVEIHESFVRDGKIKNNGAHACASNVTISYTLKNGKTITRFYTESTEGTTLRLLALNDSDRVNNKIGNYLTKTTDFYYMQSNVTMRDEEGYLDLDKYEELYGDTAYPDTDYDADRHLYDIAAYLTQEPCYLFPTDMSRGYKLGYIDKQLYNAIITDITRMSANKYFNHSAEDEIGILSFGLSNSNYMLWVEDGESVVVDDAVNPDESVVPNGTIHSTSWNVSSFDIIAIVITKDMKNTVAYLEEHNLLKHLERQLSAKDVRSVKLATMAELCDGNYENADVYPIFYGAYWTGEQMRQWVTSNEKNHYYYRLFDQIYNEITDRDRIEKLLGEGVVYGYCASDSRVMEITYNDGSVATVMVRADAVK